MFVTRGLRQNASGERDGATLQDSAAARGVLGVAAGQPSALHGLACSRRRYAHERVRGLPRALCTAGGSVLEW